MVSKDPLSFVDTKSYDKRLEEATNKTGLKDAVRTAVGNSKGAPIVIGCMDFAFIGGSMGSVVGEKICRAIDYAIKHKLPIPYDFKIRRSTYDGGGSFANADGQNLY